MDKPARFSALLLLFLLPVIRGQLETRLYAFENTPAAKVEASIRELVPDGPRVLMNAEIGQVMVIADPETHRRIDQMLKRMDRPVARLSVWIRHNREEHRAEFIDGSTFTIPVSPFPPADVVAGARQFLDAGQDRLPLVGSVLHAHVTVLSENPPVARLRLTPVVLFGVTPPYETVKYDEYTTDLRFNAKEFLDLSRALSEKDFYRGFLRGHPDPELPARSIGLLLSLERLHFAPAVPE